LGKQKLFANKEEAEVPRKKPQTLFSLLHPPPQTLAETTEISQD
jgi:hypothetical protein